MLLTHDRLYIVKQITPKERDTLLRMLERYYVQAPSSYSWSWPQSHLQILKFSFALAAFSFAGSARTMIPRHKIFHLSRNALSENPAYDATANFRPLL